MFLLISSRRKCREADQIDLFRMDGKTKVAIPAKLRGGKLAEANPEEAHPYRLESY
jgi:hypothetical protein